MNKRRILTISIQLLICLSWALYSFRPAPNAHIMNYIFFTVILSLGSFGLLRLFTSFMFKMRKPKFFKSWQEQERVKREFEEETWVE